MQHKSHNDTRMIVQLRSTWRGPPVCGAYMAWKAQGSLVQPGSWSGPWSSGGERWAFGVRARLLPYGSHLIRAHHGSIRGLSNHDTKNFFHSIDSTTVLFDLAICAPSCLQHHFSDLILGPTRKRQSQPIYKSNQYYCTRLLQPLRIYTHRYCTQIEIHQHGRL